MTIAGDYIGRVRLGVTIGVAGSQSFVWPDGIPEGTYTADAGADGLITLTATVDGDTLTVAWAAADSRRMIGHPWRVLRDGTWLFGDLYVTEAEPSDDDPTEYTVLDGAVEVTVAMVTPAGDGGGGDVFLAVANMFTAAQSIDVDVPVTALADIGTEKPTVLVHLHDAEGPRGDIWASSIDFGGGIVVSSAGRLTRRIGFDGAPTDIYLLESYAFVGVSEITSEPLYRLVVAEVESTDPGEMPWLSDLLDVTLAPMRVGDPTELDDAATKRYVDATVVATGPTPPDEPTESATAVWNRTPGNLRAFVDFRQFPDGPVDGVDANGAGGSIAPPPVVRSFTELFPLFGGVPATATDGVVRSSGEPADGGDPTSRTGFTFDGVAPGTDGRGEWGFAGYTETDATFVTYVPTNLGISAPYDDLPDGAAGPDAYLGGFVVGRFVGDTDATNPSQPVSWRCKVIRDDLGAPTTIGSAALPRTPVRGDRVAFTWTAAGRFGVEFNGEEIVTATDTTHDLTEFTAIGMVMHQGSDGDHAWEDAYYCGVEWFGVSAGDQITGDLGPHQWTDTAGWQPIGPGARPALNAITGGATTQEWTQNISRVSGDGGTVGAPFQITNDMGAITLLTGNADERYVALPPAASAVDGQMFTIWGRSAAIISADSTIYSHDGTTLGTFTVTTGVVQIARAGSAWVVLYNSTDAGGVPTSRTITAGTGLTGGGSLASDRTLAVAYGLTENTAAEGISVVHAHWRTGSYYGPSAPRTVNAGQTLASGAVRAMPFYNPVAGRTIDQLAVDVQAGSAGTGVLYVMLDDGTGYPGTVVASGTISSPSTSTRSTTSVSYTLPRGLLWIAAHGTGTTWSGLSLDGQSPHIPAATSYSPSGTTCWYATGAGTSTLTSFPSGASLSIGVLVLMRAA